MRHDLTMPDPVEPWASSQGWADVVTPRLKVGESFDWAGRTWVIEGHFTPPCCEGADELHLIRATDGDLDQWLGVPCSECRSTYTIERTAE